MVFSGTKAGRVGAQLATLLFLFTACSTNTRYSCYVMVDNGERALATEVYNSDNVARVRTDLDRQVLEFCPDHADYSLIHQELSIYIGSLYALSNYRELLLDNGYAEVSRIQTSELLDVSLEKGEDGVRLIYTHNGVVRILFKNSEGDSHILLKEMM